MHLQLTQAKLHENIDFLNDHVINVKGEDVSFYIHYWGGETIHYDNTLHKHSFFEICYIIDGEGSYREGGLEYPLMQGVMFISRPHASHIILSKKGIFIVFIAFELLELESSEEAVQRYRKLAKTEIFYLENADNTPTALMWRALLVQSLSSFSLLDDSMVSLCRALITSFEKLFNDNNDANTQRLLPQATSTFVHRAKLYIRDNLSQTLRLKDVANYLHISSRHLSRLFTIELGQSYTHYVRKERIRQASLLLSASDLSIKQISQETGFDTVHYFTTVFKEEMGVSPGEFCKKFH